MTHVHYYIVWGYGILLTPLNTNIHAYNGEVLSYNLIIGCSLSDRARTSWSFCLSTVTN